MAAHPVRNSIGTTTSKVLVINGLRMAYLLRKIENHHRKRGGGETGAALIQKMAEAEVQRAFAELGRNREVALR